MKRKKAPPKKYSKEDFLSKRKFYLGDIEKAFELGDAEIVVNKILDCIILLSFHQARINYVYSLINDYIYEKSITLCNNYANLVFITKKPFEELEIEYDNDLLKFEVIRPKIDSWASNKANTIIAKPSENFQSQIENLNTNFDNKSIFSQMIQSAKKKNNLPSLRFNNLIKGSSDLTNEFKDFSQFEIKNSVNFSNIPGNIKEYTVGSNNNDSTLTEKKIIKSISRTATKSFGYNSLKKNDDEDLPKQYPIIENEDYSGPVDELELVKEKALRTYFKEKEIERERKRRSEKERGDQNSEDERKKKKLLDDLNKNIIALDYEGMIINVKNYDADNINQLSQPSVKIREKEKIVDGVRESLREKDNLIEEKELKSSTQSGKFKNKTKTVIDQIEPALNILQKTPTNVHYISIQNTLMETNRSERNYQPNPMEYYDIRPGVTLEFFGAKKSGGKFPKIEDRMSNEEFVEKVNIISPQNNVVVKDYLKKVDEARLNEKVEKIIICEKDEENNNTTQRKTQLIKLEPEEELENKLKSFINENLINLQGNPNSPIAKKDLFEIKKKQKKHKVKAMKDFKLKDLNKFDDDEIKEAFNTPDKNLDFSIINEGKKIPRKIHVDIEKEMGYMKKYPRERVSKDILYRTGKVKINSKEKIPKNISEQKN